MHQPPPPPPHSKLSSYAAEGSRVCGNFQCYSTPDATSEGLPCMMIIIFLVYYYKQFMKHHLIAPYMNTDIDECSEGTDGCAHTCTNDAGSYSCSCQSGYQLTNDRHGCRDVDECADGTNSCNQICTNTIGSYTCSCNSGYRLASDRQTCNGKSTSLI